MGALRVGPPRAGLHGRVAVPGDKSLAHRALMLGALAEGTTRITGLPGGADVLSTLGAMRALGAQVTHAADVAEVVGCGSMLGGTRAVALDCGNSGTTMRLVMGLVAAGSATVTLDGDASLRRRPMERVAAPLRQMGARVETTDGCAPLTVTGQALRAIDCVLPVASAQVKSAILFAGLRAGGTTRVREPLPSRDHTERLLPVFGVRVERAPDGVAIGGGQVLRGATVPLPGDVSSAAFLLVAALLVPGSEVRIEDVGMNPTRTGFVDVLRRMGGAVEVASGRELAGEPHADLIAGSAALRGTTIAAAEVPGTIDELPVLAVAAALADGPTTISGAGELRVKESDRLAALEQLRSCGVALETRPDGLVVHGSGGRLLRGARIHAGGDHRIAMAFAVAGLMAEGGIVIADPECVDVSFPGFFTRLAALGATVEPA